MNAPTAYDKWTRAELDAELGARCRSVADALAFARSGNMHDEEIRRVLRMLDEAERREGSEW